MAVSHVYSNAQADATGTVTVWNGATTSSVAATNIVRPGDWNSAHNQYYSLAGNTTNASTASGTNVIFSGAGGLSVGGYTNSIVFSVNPAITHDKRYQWPPGNLTAVAALGNGSFSINRIQADDYISATRLDIPVLVSIASSATANTWGFGATCFAGIYTKNVSTLSSLSSNTTTFAFTLASNTAGSTQVIPHAVRGYSVPMNVNMSGGEYYVGFGVSTNTISSGTATTALGITQSVMGGPIYSSAVPHVPHFTMTTNTSTGLYGGQGVHSVAMSTVPVAISLSDINQTGSYYARANVGLIFRNV